MTPDGQQELVATIPPDGNAHNGDTVGVELDNKGNLYVAYKQDSPMYEANNLGDRPWLVRLRLPEPPDDQIIVLARLEAVMTSRL